MYLNLHLINKILKYGETEICLCQYVTSHINAHVLEFICSFKTKELCYETTVISL